MEGGQETPPLRESRPKRAGEGAGSNRTLPRSGGLFLSLTICFYLFWYLLLAPYHRLNPGSATFSDQHVSLHFLTTRIYLVFTSNENTLHCLKQIINFTRGIQNKIFETCPPAYPFTDVYKTTFNGGHCLELENILKR